MKTTLIALLLLPLAASASAKSLIKEVVLDESCGATHLTQWKLDFKRNGISKAGVHDFPKQYCEPVSPPTANAVAVFMDKNKQVLWTREIQVPRYLTYDYMTEKKRLGGGLQPLESATVQLKIPWNKKTDAVGWLEIQMEDGGKFGPISL